MSVRDYSHKFNSLARYAPDIVRTMRARVHHYVDGLGDHLIRDCRVASLSDDVDISRIQAFAQTTEDPSRRIRDTRKDMEQSKRARIIRSYRELRVDFRPPLHRYPPRSAGSFPPQMQGQRFDRYVQLGPGQSSGQPEGRRQERSAQMRQLTPPCTQCGPQSTQGRGRGRGGGDTSGSSGGQNRFYALTGRQDSEASPDVVTGILTIHSHAIYALMDPGSTFSYITPFIAGKLDMRSELLLQSVEVSTPVGDSIIANHVYRDCTVLINDRPTSVDLVELVMLDFDVIMGMDWLAACYANIDCRAKLVRFYFSWDIDKEPATLQSVPIVNEFPTLASLQVRLVDVEGGRILVQNTAKSSFVTEVKERQHEDPELIKLRESIPQQRQPLFELTGDGVLRYQGRLCVPSVGELRAKILSEAHYSRYAVHPGATKMYRDLRQIYWWNGMKKDIAEMVAQCPNCQQVKAKHQRPNSVY
ncbi:uncharacterized protein [Nicotiana tomentosiformis]|uniref:uncharacterized protein n=1 Tax=Nicotiana tomentosiformis TaxID=4098 RepID=UPI00388CE2AC